MNHCNQCGADWESRVEHPVQCPRCKRVDWAEPKKWTLKAQQRAHSAVHKALKDRTLDKEPCRVCGVSQVEAHHEDYDKPLDVWWLCRPHHVARHKEIGRSLVNYCVYDHPALQSVEEQLSQRRILGNTKKEKDDGGNSSSTAEEASGKAGNPSSDGQPIRRGVQVPRAVLREPDARAEQHAVVGATGASVPDTGKQAVGHNPKTCRVYRCGLCEALKGGK